MTDYNPQDDSTTDDDRTESPDLLQNSYADTQHTDMIATLVVEDEVYSQQINTQNEFNSQYIDYGYSQGDIQHDLSSMPTILSMSNLESLLPYPPIGASKYPLNPPSSFKRQVTTGGSNAVNLHNLNNGSRTITQLLMTLPEQSPTLSMLIRRLTTADLKLLLSECSSSNINVTTNMNGTKPELAEQLLTLLKNGCLDNLRCKYGISKMPQLPAMSHVAQTSAMCTPIHHMASSSDYTNINIPIMTLNSNPMSMQLVSDAIPMYKPSIMREDNIMSSIGTACTQPTQHQLATTHPMHHHQPASTQPIQHQLATTHPMHHHQPATTQPMHHHQPATTQPMHHQLATTHSMHHHQIATTQPMQQFQPATTQPMQHQLASTQSKAIRKRRRVTSIAALDNQSLKKPTTTTTTTTTTKKKSSSNSNSSSSSNMTMSYTTGKNQQASTGGSVLAIEGDKYRAVDSEVASVVPVIFCNTHDTSWNTLQDG